jgi:hypothetical protein
MNTLEFCRQCGKYVDKYHKTYYHGPYPTKRER